MGLLSFFGFGEDKEASKDFTKYKKLDLMEKRAVVEMIAPVSIPTNDKKNLVIVDDNEIAGEITKEDVGILGSIASFIREDSTLSKIPEKYKPILEKLDNDTLYSLSTLDMDDFNIILITGKMAGFQLVSAIGRGLRVDYAVLDIILGGSGVYKGETSIIDGIDLAGDILDRNPEANVMFYTGCSFEKGQDEYKRVSKLTSRINDMVLFKNNDLLYKKKRLINLLTR